MEHHKIKKTEEDFPEYYFNHKIVDASDHIIIKLKRFIKSNTVVDIILRLFSIPMFINFKNSLLEENDGIYQLESIVFYQKSMKIKGIDKDQWALFDNEKVTFPEYEQGQTISK